MPDSSLNTAARNLLDKAGATGEFSLTPLSGGANNRVYRVDCKDERYVLKAYFQHDQDPRDRLATEYAFAAYAWSLERKFGRCLGCKCFRARLSRRW